MPDAHFKELMEEMGRLRFAECSKEDILGFVEKLLSFSENLVSRIHNLEYKINALEQRQDWLMSENTQLMVRMEKIISRAGNNPREALELLLQLIREDADKNPGMIN